MRPGPFQFSSRPYIPTGTTACTDYLGKANYANSPLPVGPVDISVTGFTIVDGGSGYTVPYGYHHGFLRYAISGSSPLAVRPY